MKAVIFTTGTPDTIKLVNSFTSLPGNHGHVVQYDGRPDDIGMVPTVQSIQPDLIIYIGAIRRIHHSYVPTVDVLCQLNALAPMVHICSDSADDPWWGDLIEYDNARAFTLQVGIDGAHSSPIPGFGPRGMVALTPVDPTKFINTPWHERPHKCGWSGGLGIRADVVDPMRDAQCLQIFTVNHDKPYDELCAFYCTCKTVLNDARTGTTRFRHVKGRAIEGSLAGAVIIEPNDSPFREWFTPDIDYLTWGSPQDAINHVRAIDSMNGRLEDMGRRMRQRMLDEHAAPAFWNKVMKAMSL